MPEFRTDARGLLLDLMETSADFSRERLEGLTDEEYHWEPVPGAWSVRRSGFGGLGFGPGDHVLEYAHGDDRVTTIAWRVAHLANGFAARWEWTFGSRQVPPADVVDFAFDADAGVAQLWQWYDAWHDDITTMHLADFEAVGFSQMPTGLDPTLPFASIVWWQAREMIHHLAEVALLRDLYAART